jgi:L-alanine-DL-glutamate epimerase-like enolase superfamily enzyme
VSGAAVVASDAAVERVDVSAYTVPTDAPESDGTLEWDSTTLVLVEARAGGRTGIGWTYGDAAAGALIESKLAGAVRGRDAMDVQGAWAAMTRTIRNDGRPGISSMAISAVDVALWDLKARLLGLPLADLLGRYQEAVPIYGSGGFTSYSVERLAEQLSGWVERGIPRVKMKVGRDPGADPQRVRAARAAVGEATELFVDANGAYSRKQALELAERFAADARVSWLEEPVSSDDLEGLRLIRDRAPAGMEVAAGEYGYDLVYFERMLAAGAVDVLQADVTRCGGITELLRVDALCKARSLPLSAHCAPSIHAHACCACECLVHCEFFHDHDRVEHVLFDGALSPEGGELRPDPSRPGLGLEMKRADAERFAL